jgi:hypothetical protein
MSYSMPTVVTYKFPLHDFGAGAGASSIKAPAGFSKGRIIDIGVMDVSETFACDETAAKVQVGTSSDADAYANLVIADGAAATDVFNTQNDTDAIVNTEVDGSQLEVAFIASVDSGTAAGIGCPFVVIGWFE